MRDEQSCALVRCCFLPGVLAVALMGTGCAPKGEGAEPSKVPETRKKLDRIEELQKKTAPTGKSR
jgi:hypothetical protein